jgi:branched-chain amino acid transport system permease protein
LFIQLLLNIILTASIIILVANSFVIIYSTTKFFNLSHAAIVTIGAYMAYFFKETSLPLYFAILLAIVFSIIVGISFETLVFRVMRKRNLSLWKYLVASIGLYIIIQNCISLFFGDETKVIKSGDVIIGHEIFGGYITSIQIVTIIIAFIYLYSTNIFLKTTYLGKSVRAISNNAELSNILGIDINKIILITFIIGSAFAALTGILIALDTNMTPQFGFNPLILGVIAMIIGGIGNTKGLIKGAFLVSFAQHSASYFIDSKWMDAIAFIIFILFLLWKPLGFSGYKIHKTKM